MAATLFGFTDEAATTVSAGGTTAPTSGTVETWTVASSAQFPAASNVSSPNLTFAVSDPAAPTEVILVTNVTGNTWTVTRGAEGTIPIAHTTGFTVNGVISSTPLSQQFSTVQVPDFVIFQQFGQFYAKRGWTGENAYISATDAGTVLQSAINEMATQGGGSIWFQTGTYTWQTIPKLPAGMANWLRIVAEPGTTITLSGNGFRFCDFNKTANGQTFSYIWIEGFTIDCGAVASSLSGGSHVICGTYTGGVSPVATGTDVNFDHIKVRDCRVINGFAGPTSTAFQRAISLDCYQDGAGLAQNTITNIEIRNLEVAGCNYAVDISADKSGTWTGELNIFIDRILIDNVHHDLGGPPAAPDDFNTIRVGSHGQVGTVWVQDVWSNGSEGDVVEIDNAADAKIRNVWCQNTYGFALNATNYSAPADLNSQSYDIQNVTLVRNAGGWGPGGILGVPQNTNYSGTVQGMGHVRCRDVKMYVNAAGLADMVSDPVNGDLLLVANSALEVYLENAYYYATGYTQSNASTASVPSVISVNPAGTLSLMKLTLDDLDISFNATNSAGAAATTPRIISLNGQMDLDANNISVGCTVTTPGTGATRLVDFGSVTGTNLTGQWRGMRVKANNDTAGPAINLNSSTTLTVPTAFVIRDSLFGSQTATGFDIVFGDATVHAKILSMNNRYKGTNPRPTYTLAVPASGTPTQFLENFASAATVCINGGTVTNISQGRTSTVFQVAAATNDAIRLNNGDFFAITYSVAPTITVIPDI